MAEPSNLPPAPAPSPAPIPPVQKVNPWIIIIAVAVVIGCACFGIIGLLIAFGPEILHELGLAASPFVPVLT